jgi:hypothetical protein
MGSIFKFTIKAKQALPVNQNDISLNLSSYSGEIPGIDNESSVGSYKDDESMNEHSEIGQPLEIPRKVRMLVVDSDEIN